MESKLPHDIEFLVNEDGIFIELESFIRFLRDNKNVPDEYKSEEIHLKKIADYLSESMADLISQKRLLSEIFETDKPN